MHASSSGERGGSRAAESYGRFSGLAGHRDIDFGHVEIHIGSPFKSLEQLFAVLVHEFFFDLFIRVKAFDEGIGRFEDFVPIDVGVPKAKTPSIVAQINDVELLLVGQNARSPANHLVVKGQTFCRPIQDDGFH